MVDILKQQEAAPAAYPTVPGGLSENAAAVDSEMLWQRIESYIAHRFTVREIVWTVSGFAGDEWQPPIGPLVSHTAERWDAGAWASVTVLPGPVGLCLPSDGTFKITAQVGAGNVPAAVLEAYWRLAEYSAEIGDYNSRSGHAGSTNASMNVQGLNFQNERIVTWAAKAMQLSGAADLLRPYRRL